MNKRSKNDMGRYLADLWNRSLSVCYRGCLVVGIICGLTGAALAQRAFTAVEGSPAQVYGDPSLPTGFDNDPVPPGWTHPQGLEPPEPYCPDGLCVTETTPRSSERFGRPIRPAVNYNRTAQQQSAGYRTPNFIVDGVPEPFASQVREAAEYWRKQHALNWLGYELPPWTGDACPIHVRVGNMGAGGTTSFIFDQGRAFGWESSVQGTPKRIIETVIPHEIFHTVLASHFRRPLPRWIDEGLCTTVELPSVRLEQRKMLIHFLKSGRGIPFSRMLPMKEYPRDVLPLYAQGFSTSDFLVEHAGKRHVVGFMESAFASDDWEAAVAEHFSYESLPVFQDRWLSWVVDGSPRAPNSATHTVGYRGDDCQYVWDGRGWVDT